MALTRNPDVLLISRCPPYPTYLGDRLIPYHLAQQLAQRGYQIDLLAFYQQPEDLADVPYYERFFHDVTLLREPLRSPASLLARAFIPARRFPTRQNQSWSPEMWDAIRQKLQQRRVYQLIHLFGGVHVYEFRDLLGNYPTVITPYESYVLYLERLLEQTRNPRRRLLLRAQLAMARRYESWMYEGYGRVVVVSDKDAHTLRDLSPGLPVAVIPNGVNLDHWKPTDYEAEDPVLLFTGNFDYLPNADAARLLIRQIFPQVQQAVPEAELWIVGHNPPRDLCAAQGNGVHVTGRVPDLRPYFERAMLFTSPLRLGAGIKNKILEAMAMRTAVVATPLSCDGIEVTHGENVFLARRADEFIKAILRLIQDAPLRRQIARGGCALVERQYTWRRVADLYEALFEQVAREHRR